ncbi:DnaT-like ssDNA-binding domain-containing protein [Enterobacter asburiae]|uniref:DnaT-like ssDNA-binding domain-containing protein n=1 Tax=Enterobacter asburiae TaxID=61645 RepID=UPI0023B163E1|nr:DnaT-like ssDNA-binding domain-containing protein [Enterobacter asburiae]MDE7599646.1 DnaT-like ssDNA-binding domain-containing protein [Enterobacter asburiae]
MARIRTIKPEFWLNEELSLISETACLLAIGLMNYSDDEGFFNANPLLIKAAVFPIRETSRSIPVLLQELSYCGFIELFSEQNSTSPGKLYGRIKNFTKHQVVNKAKPSKIKHLDLVPYYYGTDTESIPPGKEGKGKDQGKEEREHNARDQPVDNSDASEQKRFRMFSEWQPSPGLSKRALEWGINLHITSPYTSAQLCQFCSYWLCEDVMKYHTQWEMTFAKSLEHQAIKKLNET